MEQEKQIQNSDWGFFPIDPSQPAPLDYMDQISYHQRKDRHDEFRTETFTPERLAELEDDNNVHNITISTRDSMVSPDMNWNIAFLSVINLASLTASEFQLIASSLSGRQEVELETSKSIYQYCSHTRKIGDESFAQYTVRCLNPDYQGEPHQPNHNQTIRHLFLKDDIFYSFWKFKQDEDGNQVYQCKNFLSQEIVEFDSIPQTKPFSVTKIISEKIALPSFRLIYDQNFSAPIEEYSFCYILRSRQKFLVVNNDMLVHQKHLKPAMNPNLFEPISQSTQTPENKKRERDDKETPPSVTQIESIFPSKQIQFQDEVQSPTIGR